MDIELALNIIIPLGIISIIMVCYYLTDKKDRPFYFSVVLIFVLIFCAIFTENLGIQLLELIGVIILIFYVIFGYIYPLIFAQQEEQFYQPRRRTVWEDIKQESQQKSTQQPEKQEKK